MGTDRPDDEELERRDHDYQWLSAAAGGLILIGTITMKLLEEWSWVDSFYFAVVTATTVGFGDISAKSEPARIAVMAQMVTNVVVLGVAARVLVHAARRRSGP